MLPGRIGSPDMKTSWKKTATGYELPEHGARLEKAGKIWTLTLRDGSTFSLGRKANFDHADAIVFA